jgi:hypothetical protein
MCKEKLKCIAELLGLSLLPIPIGVLVAYLLGVEDKVVEIIIFVYKISIFIVILLILCSLDELVRVFSKVYR